MTLPDAAIYNCILHSLGFKAEYICFIEIVR